MRVDLNVDACKHITHIHYPVNHRHHTCIFDSPVTM